MDQTEEEDFEIVGEINNTPNMENTTDQLRRSRRLPKASAKYLERLNAELEDSDTE